MCICKHVRFAVSSSLLGVEIENTSNSNSANLCASGAFRKERSSLDHVGTETGLDQLGFLLINDGTTEGLVELFGVCTTRVCVEQHLSTSDRNDTRNVFFTRSTQQVRCPANFEQVLQHGQVQDGVWTDLFDQDGPLAEPVERPEGKELDKEGLGEQVQRKRIRIKSETAEAAAQIEPDEDVFAIQEEKDHESWRLLRRQQKLKRQREQSHLGKASG